MGTVLRLLLVALLAAPSAGAWPTSKAGGGGIREMPTSVQDATPDEVVWFYDYDQEDGAALKEAGIPSLGAITLTVANGSVGTGFAAIAWDAMVTGLDGSTWGRDFANELSPSNPNPRGQNRFTWPGLGLPQLVELDNFVGHEWRTRPLYWRASCFLQTPTNTTLEARIRLSGSSPAPDAIAAGTANGASVLATTGWRQLALNPTAVDNVDCHGRAGTALSDVDGYLTIETLQRQVVAGAMLARSQCTSGANRIPCAIAQVSDPGHRTQGVIRLQNIPWAGPEDARVWVAHGVGSAFAGVASEQMTGPSLTMNSTGPKTISVATRLRWTGTLSTTDFDGDFGFMLLNNYGGADPWVSGSFGPSGDSSGIYVYKPHASEDLFVKIGKGGTPVDLGVDWLENEVHTIGLELRCTTNCAGGSTVQVYYDGAPVGAPQAFNNGGGEYALLHVLHTPDSPSAQCTPCEYVPDWLWVRQPRPEGIE